MRILFVCHRFPYPPIRGGKIRPFNMIKHLSARHEVTVASLVRSAEEAEVGRGLAEYCDEYMLERISRPMALLRMLARAPGPFPASMGNFYSPGLARRVREAVRRKGFDLIFVHCSSAAQYVEDIPGIPKVLDFGDMDSQKWLSYRKFTRFPKNLVYWLEGVKLERAERSLARKFDFCTCTTKAELDTLRGFGVATPTDWIANGVDLDFFSPSNEPYDPGSIVFVGRMDYLPNQQAVIEFCRDVFPAVREKRPEATFTVVGASPSREMRRLDAAPGVTVTGTVDDVRPYVRRAAVAVAPLRIARGTQNKMLEAMAMGVPVVASELAAKGIDAVPGEHFLVADKHVRLAETVLRLLDDPARRDRFARAGRKRVETNHDWAASLPKLDRILEELVPDAGMTSRADQFAVGATPSASTGVREGR